MKKAINKENKLLIKVTVDKFYYIDNSINGWDKETIVNDWFKEHPIDSHHATRDTYRIGYADKIRNIKIIKEGKFKSVTKKDLQ